MRHLKLKTMSMKRNQSAEDVRFAVAALNQRSDIRCPFADA